MTPEEAMASPLFKDLRDLLIQYLVLAREGREKYDLEGSLPQLFFLAQIEGAVTDVVFSIAEIGYKAGFDLGQAAALAQELARHLAGQVGCEMDFEVSVIDSLNDKAPGLF